jgi:orotate phosphoribosyltransferase
MRQKLDELLVELFVDHNVVSHKETTLYRSGLTGSDFFDIDRILGKPEPQQLLIDRIIHHVDDLVDRGLEFDTLAFIHKDIGPIGLVAYSSQISERLDKNIVIVKRWKNLRKDSLKIKGHNPSESESILLLDDVITTGSTQKMAINAIENNGGQVSGLLSIFTRDIERLNDIERRFEIEYINTLFTHKDLINIGLAFPEKYEEYTEEDFVENYPDMEGMNIEEERKEIGDLLDNKISGLLEKHGKTVDSENKQALKNLYFNVSTHIHQDDLYTSKKEEQDSHRK